MEYQNFKLSIDEKGVAIFTANRPEKMNAMNATSWAELEAFFTWADTSDEVKIVILTGAGEKAFIAGADLQSLAQRTAVDCLGGTAQKALDKIEGCSKPVIAAVNGYAFGGGCEIALACDFRIVSERGIFALPETGLGILPGAGGTQRLTRLIGIGRAKDMILLGRKVRASEAVAIGLATKCVPQEELMEHCLHAADTLLQKGPVALRVAKQVVRASASSSQEVGMLVELLALSTLCSTQDKTEGIAAFLEKRQTEFQGK